MDGIVVDLSRFAKRRLQLEMRKARDARYRIPGAPSF